MIRIFFENVQVLAKNVGNIWRDLQKNIVVMITGTQKRELVKQLSIIHHPKIKSKVKILATKEVVK